MCSQTVDSSWGEGPLGGGGCQRPSLSICWNGLHCCKDCGAGLPRHLLVQRWTRQSPPLVSRREAKPGSWAYFLRGRKAPSWKVTLEAHGGGEMQGRRLERKRLVWNLRRQLAQGFLGSKGNRCAWHSRPLCNPWVVVVTAQPMGSWQQNEEKGMWGNLSLKSQSKYHSFVTWWSLMVHPWLEVVVLYFLSWGECHKGFLDCCGALCINYHATLGCICNLNLGGSQVVAWFTFADETNVGWSWNYPKARLLSNQPAKGEVYVAVIRLLP